MGFWKLVGIEHTAELRGHVIEFCSIGKRGSPELWADAIDACKRAGIYESGNDAERIVVDRFPNEIAR